MTPTERLQDLRVWYNPASVEGQIYLALAIEARRDLTQDEFDATRAHMLEEIGKEYSVNEEGHLVDADSEVVLEGQLLRDMHELWIVRVLEGAHREAVRRAKADIKQSFAMKPDAAPPVEAADVEAPKPEETADQPKASRRTRGS